MVHFSGFKPKEFLRLIFGLGHHQPEKNDGLSIAVLGISTLRQPISFWDTKFELAALCASER